MWLMFLKNEIIKLKEYIFFCFRIYFSIEKVLTGIFGNFAILVVLLHKNVSIFEKFLEVCSGEMEDFYVYSSNL
jgi:hypothetical protein